jgi:hypothetical protein
MPLHPTFRCQRQRLNFIHRGPGGPQSRQKSLSFNSLSFDDGLSNGRSDWRSSPPAANSACFYRCSGTKSSRLPQNCNAGRHFLSVAATQKPKWGGKAPAASVVAAASGLDDAESLICVVAGLPQRACRPDPPPHAEGGIGTGEQGDRGSRDNSGRDPAEDR